MKTVSAQVPDFWNQVGILSFDQFFEP